MFPPLLESSEIILPSVFLLSRKIRNDVKFMLIYYLTKSGAAFKLTFLRLRSMTRLLKQILKTSAKEEAREREEQSKSGKKGIQAMVDNLAIPVPQFGVANSTPKLKKE